MRQRRPSPTVPPLQGKVVHGDGAGRGLGYPTANLTKHFFRFHPVRPGVYAGWATVSDRRYRAVAVVGVDEKLEVHLIAWQGTLYGKQMKFSVVKRLRGVRKFRTEALLTAQIQRDVAAAKHLLAKHLKY